MNFRVLSQEPLGLAAHLLGLGQWNETPTFEGLHVLQSGPQRMGFFF
jgi:hypothetical protein